LTVQSTSSISKDLMIHGGTLNVTSSLTIDGTLTQSSGIISGSGKLTVDGLLTWTGGVMSGSGSTIAKGGVNLGANDSVSHTESLQGRMFSNTATVNWVGTGNLNVLDGATFDNALHATFNDSTARNIASTLGSGLYTTGRFTNEGTVNISAPGTGAAGMQTTFFNTGVVNIHSGTWLLSTTGKSTGTFNISTGATFELNSHFGVGTIHSTGKVVLVDGAKTTPIVVANGAITISNGGAQLISAAGTITANSFAMSQGALVVNGNLTAAGSFVWTGGSIAGAGTINVSGSIQLGASNGTSTVNLHGTTIINHGSAKLYGSLTERSGGEFINLKGATLLFSNNGTWSGDGTVSLINDGTIISTGKWSLNSVDLENAGIVTVLTGTLSINGGHNETGVFNVNLLATLQFGNGSWEFKFGSTIEGLGTVQFGPSTWRFQFDSGSTFNVTGATNVEAAIVAFEQGSHLLSTGLLNIIDNGIWEI
jgi:hypothetical protein